MATKPSGKPAEVDEFAAGWGDDEFGDDPPAPPAEGDDPPPEVDGDPPPAAAGAEGDDPPKVDPPPAEGDDPPPEVDGDPPPAAAGAEGDDPPKVDGDPPPADYQASLKPLIDAIEDVKRGLKPPPAAPAVPDPPPVARRPKAPDLSGFKGDALKAKLAKVREADPDTADALESIVAGLAGQVETVQTALDTQRVSGEQRDAKAAQNADIALVAVRHPGWVETSQTNEFRAWLGAQPKFLQRTAVETDDPEDLIEVFDQYAASIAPKTANNGGNGAGGGEDDAARRARLEAAGRPEPRRKATNGTGKVVTTPEEEFAAGWGNEADL